MCTMAGAVGWKIAKADGTNVIQVYSMDGQLLYGTSAVGAATPAESRYIYLKSHWLGEDGVAYVHTDGLGSPIARTSASGALLSRTRYEPYGLTAAGTTPVPFGFTGQVNDVDTALVYMQQRYYDPVVGRFMSTDPVLTDANSGASFNRYAYAANNPFKYIDSDGRTAVSAELCLGKCVGITVGYSVAKTELAIIGTYGSGVGGGVSADLRPDENGRSGSDKSQSAVAGVSANVYAKASMEVGTPFVTIAEGGEYTAGVLQRWGI